MNRSPFAPEEWYHCYTRGVEKRKTFESDNDYLRFQNLLYLSNSDSPIHRSDLLNQTNADIYSVKRGNALVDIGAYCLMPNHFHILLRQVQDAGISSFMHKLGTSYTMYFNIKNERSGNLFVKPFRSKHVPDDLYLIRLLSYIHLNPLELIEPEWKEGTITGGNETRDSLFNYAYSSLIDYLEIERPESSILSPSAFDLLKRDEFDLDAQITESVEYYASMSR